ncbi:MAG: XTP/dITP diphosphatase [Planctomycetota bacterium]
MGNRRVIVLGSTNPGKLRELRRLLGDLPVELHGLGDYPEAKPPEETGQTFAENARLKATSLARQLDRWVLGEDSGLCVDALGGRPGVRSARYAGEDATDEANTAKLLEELADVDAPRRTAAYVSVVVIASPRAVLAETEGRCEGRIARRPRGQGGFGYDPVFFYPDLGATFAQVSAEAKNSVSHRGQALRRLVGRLPDLLAAAADD